MKIYYVYAERHWEYGRTNVGYYTSKDKAENAKQEFHEKAKTNPANLSGSKVDGYYIEDFHIEEIEVE